jgi:hypothetical protein
MFHARFWSISARYRVKARLSICSAVRQGSLAPLTSAQRGSSIRQYHCVTAGQARSFKLKYLDQQDSMSTFAAVDLEESSVRQASAAVMLCTAAFTTYVAVLLHAAVPLLSCQCCSIR